MARRSALGVSWSDADARPPRPTPSWSSVALELDGALEGTSSSSRPPGTVSGSAAVLRCPAPSGCSVLLVVVQVRAVEALVCLARPTTARDIVIWTCSRECAEVRKRHPPGTVSGSVAVLRCPAPSGCSLLPVAVQVRAVEALICLARPTTARDLVIWLRSRAAPLSGCSPLSGPSFEASGRRVGQGGLELSLVGRTSLPRPFLASRCRRSTRTWSLEAVLAHCEPDGYRHFVAVCNSGHALRACCRRFLPVK